MPSQGTSAPDSIRVDVHYPLDEGRIVLRSEGDWDADIEAASVEDDGRLHRFEVASSEPFLYYKAVRVDASGEHWSCGPNRLATTGADRAFDAFPFFEPAGAQLTELETVTGPSGSWEVRVCLPPGYEENACHRYPVLFMNDGHTLFFRQESPTGKKWDVQDTLSQLDEMTSVEQVIVVAVYPVDRMRDYGSEGSEAYASFLADTLVPWVDERFRTLPDASHRALLGSSLGGVSALHCAWSRPDALGMAGCLSASFGYDDDLKERVLAGPRPDLRIYLDSGWPRDNFEVTRDMRARLTRAGFTEGQDLLYFAFPGARHSETDWGDRVHLPFQFFFGQRPDVRSRAGRAAKEARRRSSKAKKKTTSKRKSAGRRKNEPRP